MVIISASHHNLYKKNATDDATCASAHCEEICLSHHNVCTCAWIF